MSTKIFLRISFLLLALQFFACSKCFSQIETSQLDRLFESKYNEVTTGASVLISKRDKIIYRKQFGYANSEHNIRVNENTKFAIGSITKQFTATAILILQEQGKLNIDNAVGKYLADFDSPNYSNVTLKHLLNHTSGVPSDTPDKYISKNFRKNLSPQDRLNKIKDEALLFDPGTAYDYSNTGYIMLGKVIEAITGLTYNQFLSKRIFDPLGMDHTCVGNYQELIANRANGYAEDDNGNTINATYHSSSFAAGAIISTPGDLQKWVTALFAEKIINKNSLLLMTDNNSLKNKEQINMGLGWELNEIKGQKSYEHSGFEPGYKANSIYIPSDELYIIVMQNTESGSPIPISIKAAAITMNSPYPLKKEAKQLAKMDLAKYIGTYQLPNGDKRMVVQDNNQLYYKAPGGKERALYADEKNQFFFNNEYISFTFSEDEKGNIISALYKNRISSSKLKKISNEIPKKKQVITIDENIMKTYVGSYKSDQFLMNISMDNSGLFAQPEGSDKLELLPTSNTHFFIQEIGAEIEFVKNENNQVEYISIQLEGNTMKGLKLKN